MSLRKELAPQGVNSFSYKRKQEFLQNNFISGKDAEGVYKRSGIIRINMVMTETQ